jgi:hypothetical protein
MSQQKRILLFETSALLSTLAQFTDPFTNAPDALERLLKPLKPGDQPLIDEIKIPDHVVYELTGLLPISFPEMQRRFAQAKEAGDEKALNEAIELYALASPRGEVRDPKGEQKNHIRVLLRFLANHPDSLMETEISKAFCQRLKADYSVLSSSSEQTLQQYRPTFADAFEYLGNNFKADTLRVHAGQLLMMGLINESEFNERLDLVEKDLGHKKRFFKTNDLLEKMAGKENTKNKLSNGVTLKKDVRRQGEPTRMNPGDLSEHIKREEAQRSRKTLVDEKEGYLTVGTFMRHPQLLRIPLSRYQVSSPSGIEKVTHEDAALVKSAFGPSHLMMEHYLHSGLVPNTNETLLILANALHFDSHGFTIHSDHDHLAQHLEQQGFYELRPTVADLNAMRDALASANIEAPLLTSFLNALPQAEKAMQKRFNEACRNPQSRGLGNHTELKIPNIGLPYEKVFGDAVVNGALSWQQFSAIVQATDGLHQNYAGGYKGTQKGDILLKPSTDPSEAKILISQGGFVGRSGKTATDDYISGAPCTILESGEKRNYLELSAADLIRRCRASLSNSRFATKLYRVFETMLYRPITLDAADVRYRAIQVIGEERLVQIEKDFANRHARKSNAVQPPYMSMFAALHVNTRIGRKNLGEVATAEAASTLLAAGDFDANTHIFLANHDSDLFPDEKTRDTKLEASVVRQHGAWFPATRMLNDQMSGQNRLHFVNSNQLLASLDSALGRTPREKYHPIVQAKPFIEKHKSDSWVQHIDLPIQESHQRR